MSCEAQHTRWSQSSEPQHSPGGLQLGGVVLSVLAGSPRPAIAMPSDSEHSPSPQLVCLLLLEVG